MHYTSSIHTQYIKSQFTRIKYLFIIILVSIICMISLNNIRQQFQKQLNTRFIFLTSFSLSFRWDFETIFRVQKFHFRIVKIVQSRLIFTCKNSL